MITPPARPESLTFAPQQSALTVIDIQNVYASQGGYLDLVSLDVSATRPVIDSISTAVAAARAAGVLTIRSQSGWDDQYAETGGLGSPNYHKPSTLKMMRQRPELQGELLVKGGQDYQLMNELAPQEGDIVLPKLRYSGFFNIPLGSTLCSRDIRHLVFIGIVTSVCVEPTLHDGFSLEYLSIALEDAAHQVGLAFTQRAVLFNIETFFGWTSGVESFCYALSPVISLSSAKEKRYV